MAKRFALMALAEAGSRKGQGEDPWSGTAKTRAELLGRLSRGKKAERAWAGLALGVFGYHLDAMAQDLDSGVDRALMHAARKARTADDLGALALALGLRRSIEAEEMLLSKVENLKDPAARGHAALALGLMESRSSIERLQELLSTEDLNPTLQARCGLALGILGDSNVVETLVAKLEKSESIEEQAAIAQALSELMLDTDAGYVKSRDNAVIALSFLADSQMTSWRSLLSHGCNYRAETPTLTSREGKGVLDLP